MRTINKQVRFYFQKSKNKLLSISVFSFALFLGLGTAQAFQVQTPNKTGVNHVSVFIATASETVELQTDADGFFDFNSTEQGSITLRLNGYISETYFNFDFSQTEPVFVLFENNHSCSKFLRCSH